MKILNFLAAFLLFTLCTNGYCYNNNKTIYKEEATIPQDEIKIISTFTVTAKVARISGIFPNQYLKYTNQVTLTIAIYSNSVASVIAVGNKQLTRVRDKDCVKNRVKRAKIVRFTLC